MSVSLGRQGSTSYSSRSITSNRSMQVVGGGGQTRISTGGPLQFDRSFQTGGPLLAGGFVQNRAPSVYGGAGGYGTRVSQSYSAFSPGSQFDTAVIGNEKGTMQNLNDRLATYLEKVRTLEAANRKLEQQIREFYEKKTIISRDYTAYTATISDLRAKIAASYSEKQRVILQIDNAQLAAEDFKIKFESEMNMRSNVEADVMRLRGGRDSLTLNISDLEMQIEGLKEELAYMRSNHEEEMNMLRVQQGGSVNVEVDSTESVDLDLVLKEVREQYEAQMIKNSQELEKWFQLKMDGLNTEITVYTDEVKTYHSQLTELKRTYQSLQISLQSEVSRMQCVQQNLDETKSRFGFQLSHLQMTVHALETELQQLNEAILNQKDEYRQLLDIKMRLELEIAEYRRLLGGEKEVKKAVIISKVVEVEEHVPHIERRTKTITEEIIDGKVVSSSVDTQVEDIQ
ncbi:keratin, type I cytoskeletal 19-like [Centropristis striata]|uniref:keratin, type I cytoskeletal 19-like n=1 Tax=Centropristis striata TaxID=184440 RepID=UPI0027E10475|nr:keratin, type I cytoskeletal 19-like [Centropristis striata]